MGRLAKVVDTTHEGHSYHYKCLCKTCTTYELKLKEGIRRELYGAHDRRRLETQRRARESQCPNYFCI